MKAVLLFASIPALLLTLLLGATVVVTPTENVAASLCSSTSKSSASKPSQWNRAQLANAAIIIAIGKRRRVPPRGLVVAVTAAMQESSLRNLTDGDRDSAGLFQMRPSAGWGTQPQVTNAAYAATAFFGGPDVPPANTGLLDIEGWQELSVAEAAQAVERSAHPMAYEKWTADATALVATITRSDLNCDGAPATGRCEASDLPGENGLTPAAQQVLRCTVERFGITNIGGRASSGHIPGSDHYTGRAVDIMIANWGTPTGAQQGDQVASYFVANADAFDVKYVIWRSRIWSKARPTWRPYGHPSGAANPTLQHMDHVHVSVNGTTN